MTPALFEKIAVIRSAGLSNADHGVLTAIVDLDYGRGGRQVFGGYCLYSPKYGASLAGHFIWRMLKVAGVTEWNKLPGQYIRVRCADEFGLIHSVGHVLNDDWFVPEVDFAFADGRG